MRYGTQGEGVGEREKKHGSFLTFLLFQQWYNRKKPEANCYMGDKFTDPVEHEENCECEDEDYEWYSINFLNK